MITGNLKIISNSRIRKFVSKGPKYRFPSYINFDKCALDHFGSRWCKREGVENGALKARKRSIFTIVDKRIESYSQHTNILPPKPKSSFRHLKQGIQEFYRKYVFVPAADKAAKNVVVDCRLHYTNTLRQEFDGTMAYKETDSDKICVVNAHLNELPVKFSVCVNECQNKLHKKTV